MYEPLVSRDGDYLKIFDPMSSDPIAARHGDRITIYEPWYGKPLAAMETLKWLLLLSIDGVGARDIAELELAWLSHTITLSLAPLLMKAPEWYDDYVGRGVVAAGRTRAGAHASATMSVEYAEQK